MKKIVMPLLLLSLVCTACTGKDNKGNDTINDMSNGFIIEQDNYVNQPYWRSWEQEVAKTEDEDDFVS